MSLDLVTEKRLTPPATIQQAMDLRKKLGQAIKRYGKQVDSSLTDDILLHTARCNHSRVMKDIVDRMRVLSDLKKARSVSPETLSEVNEGILLAAKICIEEEKLFDN
jgi:hypothetical protein